MELVAALQKTFQLVPDAQVIPVVNQKYPTQQYEQGAPEKLVVAAMEQVAASKKIEKEKSTASVQHGNSTSIESSSCEDLVDIDAFAAILRSKSVCAWGECYHKKRTI